MFAKIAASLISPLGTSLLLGLFALLLPGGKGARWRRGARVSVVLALAWLWLWSMPVASEALRGWLENQAGPRRVNDLPQVPVMVVLGGGVSGPRPPQRPYPDLGAAADRVWYAARLFHAGKAQKVILSGGVTRGGDGSEAAAMRAFLLDLGVPEQSIELEAVSPNTLGNARNTAALLAREGHHRVLLVTSALHMLRARRLFEKVGLTVVPAPTDFEVAPMPFDLLRLLPDTKALDGSGRAMKELVGWMVGR